MEIIVLIKLSSGTALNDELIQIIYNYKYYADQLLLKDNS